MRRIMMAALMSAALMVPAGFASAADPATPRVEKIAVVDAQALVTKSKAGKSIQGQIEKQRDVYRAQLSKIEKELMEDGKKLQDTTNKGTAEFAANNKAFEAKKASYQKQAQEKGQALEKGAGEAILAIRTAVAGAVKDIAAKDHYTLILTRDNVVLAEEGMDITEQVMAQLDKALPDVKLNVSAAKAEAPSAAPAAAPAKK
ncbi:MAG: outer membrane protein precursor [Micavibrio sp.]|nr:outer membrane protein precursor [Micavibrio sp.]